MSSGLTRLVNRLTLVTNPVSPLRSPLILSSRAFVPYIYGYKTRCKRMKKERGKSLDWAEPLLAQATPTDGEANGGSGEPHMLHLVQLVKRTSGRPWWEKEIVKKLMLEGKLYQPVIHKNTPSVNRLLSEIKHLIRIQPLTFPHGLPVSEADWEHARINTRGEMIVVQRLKDSSTTVADPNPEQDKWMMDLETVNKDLNKKIADYSVHEEYFRAQYKYRRNEDGKMYRYSFNKDYPKYEW